MKAKALQYCKTHWIVPYTPDITGLPHDHGLALGTITSDGKIADIRFYQVQTKSAYRTDDKGNIIFSTCHNSGKPYTEDEVDFFYLYYNNPKTQEEWRGLALLCECGTSLKIPYSKISKDYKNHLDDYAFDSRFHELLTTGSLTVIEKTHVEDDAGYLCEEDDISFDEPDLEDDATFDLLLQDCEWDLDLMANTLKIPKKILMKHHANYVNRGPSHVA